MAVQRVKRRTPRGELKTSVPPDTVTVLCPARIEVYALSNAIVAQAARVQARFGPAVSVSPASVNDPPHVLQSARVDNRPSASVNVYVAAPGTACSGWPSGCSEDSVHVPASWPAVRAALPLPADGDVGVVGASEHADRKAVARTSREVQAKRVTRAERGKPLASAVSGASDGLVQSSVCAPGRSEAPSSPGRDARHFHSVATWVARG